MDKVARIVSQDFHSPDGKIEFRKRQLEFQRNMDEVELIISVDTADDAMMTIFVFPDESARLRTENKRLELKYDEVFGVAQRTNGLRRRRELLVPTNQIPWRGRSFHGVRRAAGCGFLSRRDRSRDRGNDRF